MIFELAGVEPGTFVLDELGNAVAIASEPGSIVLGVLGEPEPVPVATDGGAVVVST